mmetsp:Transcript_26008/g.32438  ORF Transcript_26008/g.32438 Transcript_26008/m.32438 type:complete len:96 (-) Transcript_26008:46-333(-)
MCCGGITGQISWIAVYPSDVIKTRIQQEADRKLRIRDVIRAIYAANGPVGFYSGLAPTLARTFMINTVRLPFFEYVNEKFCPGETSGTVKQQHSD